MYAQSGSLLNTQKSNDKTGDVITWNALPDWILQGGNLQPTYQPKENNVVLNEALRELENVRQELQAVTERYKALIQQSSEIIWRCELQIPININDPEEKQLTQLFNGYLAECNDQMAHFYGYENAAGVIGKKVSVFFDPNEPVTRQVVTEFIQQGYNIYRRLSMHIDHQGNKRYFLNNLVGVVEEGQLLRVWTTQNEITAATDG